MVTNSTVTARHPRPEQSDTVLCAFMSCYASAALQGAQAFHRAPAFDSSNTPKPPVLPSVEIASVWLTWHAGGRSEEGR